MEAVYDFLNEKFPSAFIIKLPYLDSIGDEAIKYLNQSDFIFFGGTNALSSEMEVYKQWGIDKNNYSSIKNVILIGVGWWQYQGEISLYTQKILKNCLHSTLFHSVRDSYTKNKLSTIGINNVIVTGCPTLWALTKEHCKSIKKEKSENVLLTFTSYSQDKSDFELLKILRKNYRNIFVWIQGPEDFQYAKNLGTDLKILPPNLKSLDELLSSDIELDYIGTRLHAGIRAMKYKRRAIIIGVDNRAIEMQKDFNLTVIPRHDLGSLHSKINSDFETDLHVPFDKIQQWKEQFSYYLTDNFFQIHYKKKISIKPISNVFGFDRGTPIDRYYIDKFLKKNSSFICGRTLEIGDNSYTKKYGKGVTKSEVLNAVPSPQATIVGDLATGLNIPESSFDCIILTQTIQCIYDVKAALENAFKALKPGGTLLITASGISQISRYDMDRWGEYWRFTDKSLKMLLEEVAPECEIEVQTFGNVAVAKAYLDGLAWEELPNDVLEFNDQDYQLVITAKVQKRAFSHPSKHTKDKKLNKSFETPLVLLYHRVADDPIDSQLLAVSPKNFDSHLKELSENYRVISLYELIEELQQGVLNPDTVALTFDDGYLDNLTNALPLLEKYKLHATVFVVTGMVGSEQEFWWDTLERIFLTGEVLPENLSVTSQRGKRVWDLRTAQGRLNAYDELCEILRSDQFEDIQQSIHDLLEWAGMESTGRLSHRILNHEQLIKLAESRFIEIGSHSVTHTRLTVLTPEGQRWEIKESKKQLETIIKRPIRFISYPYGTVTDFSQDTAKIIVEEGYIAGISNIQGNIGRPVDLYAIPRRLVRNWSGEVFTKWLMDKDKGRLEVATISTRQKRLIDHQLAVAKK